MLDRTGGVAPPLLSNKGMRRNPLKIALLLVVAVTRLSPSTRPATGTTRAPPRASSRSRRRSSGSSEPSVHQALKGLQLFRQHKRVATASRTVPRRNRDPPTSADRTRAA